MLVIGAPSLARAAGAATAGERRAAMEHVEGTCARVTRAAPTRFVACVHVPASLLTTLHTHLFCSHGRFAVLEWAGDTIKIAIAPARGCHRSARCLAAEVRCLQWECVPFADA